MVSCELSSTAGLSLCHGKFRNVAAALPDSHQVVQFGTQQVLAPGVFTTGLCLQGSSSDSGRVCTSFHLGTCSDATLSETSSP